MGIQEILKRTVEEKLLALDRNKILRRGYQPPHEAEQEEKLKHFIEVMEDEE